jgi:ubiquitin carboxyl-terminal hydrolase 5/13
VLLRQHGVNLLFLTNPSALYFIVCSKGSGGTNGALDHFQETGQIYPLVVKLGTITTETADCYSYAPDEDGPVLVPNLRELLAKRGIQMQSLYVFRCSPMMCALCRMFSYLLYVTPVNRQKTVKSTAELEVELNATYAFDAITEAGTELQPVSGPGFQGLQNLGNSCYMNSVFQMLLSGVIPELAHRYGVRGGADDAALIQHPLLQPVLPTAAPLDVLCQTCKLASALTSGRFAKPVDVEEPFPHPKYRLAPRMMKHCIGKDHVDFRTAQQQDAAQFLLYFLERLDRAELGAASLFRDAATGTLCTSSHLFAFSTTERRVCTADGKVRYQTSRAPETLWSLRVPMEKATVNEEDVSPEQKKLKSDDSTVSAASEANDDEKKAPAVPSISLQACIEEWASTATVENVRWSHLQQAMHPALQTVRLTNFPRYLIVQIQRYELGPDWVPVKLEVNLLVPEELDITQYKSTGPSEGEVLIPDDGAAGIETAKPATPVMNEAALAQLMDMGFSLNSCKRALTAVGGNDVEAAMGWVFEHNVRLFVSCRTVSSL